MLIKSPDTKAVLLKLIRTRSLCMGKLSKDIKIRDIKIPKAGLRFFIPCKKDEPIMLGFIKRMQGILVVPVKLGM